MLGPGVNGTNEPMKSGVSVPVMLCSYRTASKFSASRTNSAVLGFVPSDFICSFVPARESNGLHGFGTMELILLSKLRI